MLGAVRPVTGPCTGLQEEFFSAKETFPTAITPTAQVSLGRILPTPRAVLGQAGHGAAAETAPKTPSWKTRAWQRSVSPAEFYNILPPAFSVLF